MQFFKAVFCLFIGLLAFVNAVPISDDGLQHLDLNVSNPNLATTLGYDPSFDWHQYSMIQIWMGKAKSTVGPVIGQELYNTIYKMLDDSCPPAANGGENYCLVSKPNGRNEIKTRCIRNWPADIVDCFTSVLVTAQWQNNNIRSAMISAVAGSLAATTIQGVTGGTNCFDMAGKKACNIGDAVRVNFPNGGFGDNKRFNFWHLKITNPSSQYGSYDCCKGGGLQEVDRVADALERKVRDGYPEVWGNPWFRDSRCIINEWATCP